MLQALHGVWDIVNNFFLVLLLFCIFNGIILTLFPSLILRSPVELV